MTCKTSPRLGRAWLLLLLLLSPSLLLYCVVDAAFSSRSSSSSGAAAASRLIDITTTAAKATREQYTSTTGSGGDALYDGGAREEDEKNEPQGVVHGDITDETETSADYKALSRNGARNPSSSENKDTSTNDFAASSSHGGGAAAHEEESSFFFASTLATRDDLHETVRATLKAEQNKAVASTLETIAAAAVAVTTDASPNGGAAMIRVPEVKKDMTMAAAAAAAEKQQDKSASSPIIKEMKEMKESISEFQQPVPPPFSTLAEQAALAIKARTALMDDAARLNEQDEEEDEQQANKKEPTDSNAAVRVETAAAAKASSSLPLLEGIGAFVQSQLLTPLTRIQRGAVPMEDVSAAGLSAAAFILWSLSSSSHGMFSTLPVDASMTSSAATTSTTSLFSSMTPAAWQWAMVGGCLASIFSTTPGPLGRMMRAVGIVTSETAGLLQERLSSKQNDYNDNIMAKNSPLLPATKISSTTSAILQQQDARLEQQQGKMLQQQQPNPQKSSSLDDDVATVTFAESSAADIKAAAPVRLSTGQVLWWADAPPPVAKEKTATITASQPSIIQQVNGIIASSIQQTVVGPMAQLAPNHVPDATILGAALSTSMIAMACTDNNIALSGILGLASAYASVTSSPVGTALRAAGELAYESSWFVAELTRRVAYKLSHDYGMSSLSQQQQQEQEQQQQQQDDDDFTVTEDFNRIVAGKEALLLQQQPPAPFFTTETSIAAAKEPVTTVAAAITMMDEVTTPSATTIDSSRNVPNTKNGEDAIVEKSNIVTSVPSDAASKIPLETSSQNDIDQEAWLGSIGLGPTTTLDDDNDANAIQSIKEKAAQFTMNANVKKKNDPAAFMPDAISQTTPEPRVPKDNKPRSNPTTADVPRLDQEGWLGSIGLGPASIAVEDEMDDTTPPVTTVTSITSVNAPQISKATTVQNDKPNTPAIQEQTTAASAIEGGENKGKVPNERIPASSSVQTARSQTEDALKSTPVVESTCEPPERKSIKSTTSQDDMASKALEESKRKDELTRRSLLAYQLKLQIEERTQRAIAEATEVSKRIELTRRALLEYRLTLQANERTQSAKVVLEVPTVAVPTLAPKSQVATPAAPSTLTDLQEQIPQKQESLKVAVPVAEKDQAVGAGGITTLSATTSSSPLTKSPAQNPPEVKAEETFVEKSDADTSVPSDTASTRPEARDQKDGPAVIMEDTQSTENDALASMSNDANEMTQEPMGKNGKSVPPDRDESAAPYFDLELSAKKDVSKQMPPTDTTTVMLDSGEKTPLHKSMPNVDTNQDKPSAEEKARTFAVGQGAKEETPKDVTTNDSRKNITSQGDADLNKLVAEKSKPTILPSPKNGMPEKSVGAKDALKGKKTITSMTWLDAPQARSPAFVVGPGSPAGGDKVKQSAASVQVEGLTMTTAGGNLLQPPKANGVSREESFSVNNQYTTAGVNEGSKSMLVPPGKEPTKTIVSREDEYRRAERVYKETKATQDLSTMGVEEQLKFRRDQEEKERQETVKASSAPNSILARVKGMKEDSKMELDEQGQDSKSKDVLNGRHDIDESKMLEQLRRNGQVGQSQPQAQEDVGTPPSQPTPFTTTKLQEIDSMMALALENETFTVAAQVEEINAVLQQKEREHFESLQKLKDDFRAEREAFSKKETLLELRLTEVSEASQELHKELTKKDEELAQVRQELARAGQVLTETKQAKEEGYEVQLAMLAEQLALEKESSQEANRRAASLEERCDITQRELETYQRKMQEQAQQSKDLSLKLDSVHAEYRDKFNELKEAYEAKEKRRLDDSVETQSSQVQEYERRIQSLQEQLTLSVVRHHAEIRQKDKETEHRLESQQKQLRREMEIEHGHRVDALENELSVVKQQYAKSEEERWRLRLEADTVTIPARDALHKELKELELQHSLVEEELHRYKENTIRLNRDLREREDRLEEMATSLTEAETMHKQHIQSLQATQSQELLERDQAMAEQQKEFRDAELQFKDDIAKKEVDLEQVKAVMNARISELQNELEQMHVSLVADQTSAQNKDSLVQDRFQELQTSYERARNEVTAERTRHENVEADLRVEIANLEGKLRLGESSLDEKRLALEELQQQLTREEELSSFNARQLITEIETLKREVKQQKYLVERERIIVETKEEELQEVQDEMKELRLKADRVQEMEGSVAELQSALADLEDSKIAHTVEVSKLEKENTNLKEHLADFEKQCTNLTAELELKFQQAESLAESILELEEQLKAERQSKQDLIDRIRQARQPLQAQEGVASLLASRVVGAARPAARRIKKVPAALAAALPGVAAEITQPMNGIVPTSQMLEHDVAAAKAPPSSANSNWAKDKLSGKILEFGMVAPTNDKRVPLDMQSKTPPVVPLFGAAPEPKQLQGNDDNDDVNTMSLPMAQQQKQQVQWGLKNREWSISTKSK